MKFYPFKIVHEINEDDLDRRVHVCDRMESMIRENQNLFNNVILSDECAFDKNGTVHRLNRRTVGVRITNIHINFEKAKQNILNKFIRVGRNFW